MTPESLDKWLQEFGENVSIRNKKGSKQCSVDNLRKYIKQAIEVAVQRERLGSDETINECTSVIPATRTATKNKVSKR